MQLESSDESLACWVGLQSTPSSGVRETAECRDILSAASGWTAVEANGDTVVLTMWAASASDGSACRLAHGDGWFQRRGQPLSFIDCAGGPGFSRSFGRRGFGHRAQRADRAERLAVQFVVAGLGGGIANT
jgi:hypothetical protein